jgi:hypothetical protein
MGQLMILRAISLAAIAATSIGAQAALTTYAPWNAAMPNLVGVEFNVVSANSITVALGAHAFKNGINLPNNGVDTFYAQPGTYAGPPPQGDRANWSFDFFVNRINSTCSDCTVSLFVDTDPTAGAHMVKLFETALGTGGDSWNMEMAFITTVTGYDFNPYGSSSTAFALVVNSASGGEQVRSDITVNVPEPGSLALVGLALAGVAALRRRQA